MSSPSPAVAPDHLLSLAVLDDYASLSTPIWTSLTTSPSTTLSQTSYFPDTLDPRLPADLPDAVARLQPYTIISTMRERTPFPAQLLQQLPNLRLLLTTGMRNAALDLKAAADAGVVVLGTKTRAGRPGFESTAQHTWSLILALTSRIPVDDAALKTAAAREGTQQQQQPPYWQSGFATSLGGKTLGLVGLGKLGAQVARTGLLGFGMQAMAWSENLTQNRADETMVALGLPVGTVKVVPKEELFREADVISLHLVLSQRSAGVVGEKELASMKKSAFLVNTSRAGLVDENALFQELERCGISGAGLDVWWKEPLGAYSRWRSTEWGRDGRGMLVMSPHMGYVEEQTMRGWYEEQKDLLVKWSKGEDVSDNKMN